MNDNEIIKTLKCCGNDECSKCPLQDGVCSEKDIMKQALDLINRQKAEIEHITEKFKCQQAVYADLSKIIKEQAEKLKAVKSETIKEFAERVKLKFYEEFDQFISSIMANEINILVKEMVGEN